MLSARAISTSIYSSDMDFHRFILTHIGNELKEGQILAITSKLVSLAEKRLVSQNSINKKELVEKESDYYLGEIAYDCHLTIKHGQLIPSAGIDESNSEDGSYILYPITPYASAQKIHAFLSQELGIERFGILLTDSHTVALRRGVIGTALAYHGFEGIADKRGEEDIFGRTLKMTQINVADALAVTATYLMGEGNEQKPFVLLEDESVSFTNARQEHQVSIPLEEDLYAPVLLPLIQGE